MTCHSDKARLLCQRDHLRGVGTPLAASKLTGCRQPSNLPFRRTCPETGLRAIHSVRSLYISAGSVIPRYRKQFLGQGLLVHLACPVGVDSSACFSSPPVFAVRIAATVTMPV